MRRTAVAFVSLAACAPGLRAADLDRELAALRPPPPEAPAMRDNPLQRSVIRITADEVTRAVTPGTDDRSGPVVRITAPAPRARVTAPRPATAPPADLAVGERLVVAPLPPASSARVGAAAPGALDASWRGPRETTVPVASTGVLDGAAAGAYDDALSLVRADRCHDALDAFASFLARWPDHPHADNAMYWRGECLLRIGETQRGLEEFTSLVARYPAGNKVPDALLKLALTWGRLGDGARAEEAARRLLEDFPGSDAARRMRAERQMR